MELPCCYFCNFGSVPNSFGTNEGANLLQEVVLKNNSTKNYFN